MNEKTQRLLLIFLQCFLSFALGVGAMAVFACLRQGPNDVTWESRYKQLSAMNARYGASVGNEMRVLMAQRDACTAKFSTGTVLYDTVPATESTGLPSIPLFHGLVKLSLAGAPAQPGMISRARWFIPAKIEPTIMGANVNVRCVFADSIHGVSSEPCAVQMQTVAQ